MNNNTYNLPWRVVIDPQFRGSFNETFTVVDTKHNFMTDHVFYSREDAWRYIADEYYKIILDKE